MMRKFGLHGKLKSKAGESEKLSQVLLERTGTQDRVFEPVPPDGLGDLSKLREELEFVNSCSESMAVADWH